jgi:putative phosphoribosyl transferase
MSWMRFRDRKHAGQLLARALVKRRIIHDPVVVAVPRGGAAVGSEVAQRLGAPFDLRIVVKVCVPGHEELAMGAVAAHGLHVLDDNVVNQLGLTPAALGRALAQAEGELDLREALFQTVRRPPLLAGRSVVLIDDGMASGATMAAAVRALRREGPAHILAAVPVAPESAIARLAPR